METGHFGMQVKMFVSNLSLYDQTPMYSIWNHICDIKEGLETNASNLIANKHTL